MDENSINFIKSLFASTEKDKVEAMLTNKDYSSYYGDQLGYSIEERISKLGNIKLNRVEKADKKTELAIDLVHYFISNKIEANGKKHLPFQEVYEKICDFYLLNLRKEKVDFPFELNSSSIIDDLTSDLIPILEPALYEDFDLFRAKRNKSIFVGNYFDKVEEKNVIYCDYLDFFTAEINGFIQKYQVALFLSIEKIFNSIEDIKILRNRLIADEEKIRCSINISYKYLRIVSIKRLNSDYHNSGKCNYRISGKDFVVIYKSKDLSFDVIFNDFLDIYNLKNGSNLKHVKTINFKNYGYCEEISHNPPSEKKQFEEFYYKGGQFLCLAYVLRITDLHFENIISCNNSPFLVDLETSIYPKLKSNTLSDNFAESSVIFSQMLVTWMNYLNGSSCDTGGLTGEKRQKIYCSSKEVNYPNSDLMSIRNSVRSEFYPNVKNGVKLTDFQLNKILEGFRFCYINILKYKGEYAAIIEEFFRNISVRYIERPTWLYSTILMESLDAASLRDPVLRLIKIDKLSQFYFKNVINKERSCYFLSKDINYIWKAEIPYYTFRTSHADMSLDQSDRPNFFEEEPIVSVISTIENLSLNDLDRQLTLITSSILSKLKVERKSISTCIRTSIEKRNFVKVAEEIYHRTLNSLFTMKELECSANTFKFDSEYQNYRFSSASNTLYDGIPSLAILSSALFEVTQKEEYYKVANICLIRLAKVFNSDDSIYAQTGAFYGVGSLVYTISYVSKRLGLKEEKVLKLCDRKFDRLSSAISSNGPDLTHGNAGLILSLKSIQHLDSCKVIIEKSASKLKSDSLSIEDRIYWEHSASSRKFLLGMSHGNSGIAWALASAGSLLKDKSLLMLARTVVNSEDYYYDRKKKNWPDFRADSSDMKSWCHGAPGIVLARYLLSKINPTLFPIEPYEEILNELSKIESKAGNTCCGLAGISDILITTSNDKNKNLEDAERILLSIIDESSCSYGFRTVANRENGIVSTSLMQGELGIAHTLLRHYSAQNGRPLGSFLSLE